MPGIFIFVTLLLAITGTATMAANTKITSSIGAIEVDLDTTTFQYTIKVNGKDWFTSRNSADTGYAFSADGSYFSRSDGTLRTLGQPTAGGGADEAGTFKSITISWTRNTSLAIASAEWVTAFKV